MKEKKAAVSRTYELGSLSMSMTGWAQKLTMPCFASDLIREFPCPF